MIAERPEKSKIQDDAEEDLFQGLNFPEVPTAPVAPTHLTYMKDDINTTSSQAKEIIIQESNFILDSKSVNKNESEKRKTNLATLYATEVSYIQLVSISLTKHYCFI